MARLTARRGRFGVILAALLLPLLALASPARAADPIPTTTSLHMTGDNEPGGTILLLAIVTADSGTPAGTVTFTGSFPTQSAPVGPDGHATVTIAGTGGDIVGTASFVGTGGYGDSISRTITWPAPDSTTWHPEPTIARIGGAFGLQLTLTMAARITNAYGFPRVGVPVTFTLLGPLPAFPNPSTRPAIEVCKAITDANGRATCGGKAAVGSILSVLTGAYANRLSGPFPTGEHTKLPVILAG